MYLPISAAAWATVWLLLLCWTTAFSDWLSSRALNCAIWAIICVSSIGFIGSWFCICAMSSFRKSVLPSWLAWFAGTVLMPGWIVEGTVTWLMNELVSGIEGFSWA